MFDIALVANIAVGGLVVLGYGVYIVGGVVYDAVSEIPEAMRCLSKNSQELHVWSKKKCTELLERMMRKKTITYGSLSRVCIGNCHRCGRCVYKDDCAYATNHVVIICRTCHTKKQAYQKTPEYARELKAKQDRRRREYAQEENERAKRKKKREQDERVRLAHQSRELARRKLRESFCQWCGDNVETGFPYYKKACAACFVKVSCYTCKQIVKTGLRVVQRTVLGHGLVRGKLICGSCIANKTNAMRNQAISGILPC